MIFMFKRCYVALHCECIKCVFMFRFRIFLTLKRNLRLQAEAYHFAGLIGMLLILLMLGSACVFGCVCLWKISDLSLGKDVTAWVLPSWLSCSDNPMAEGRFFSSEGPEASGFTYHMDVDPDKTLEHVCGNEELHLCVRAIYQWPPPISLLTWRSPSPLSKSDVFSYLFPPPCSTLGGTKNNNNSLHPCHPC